MIYSQETGAFTLGGKVIGYGYAGNGPDKNTHTSQSKRGKGPLPVGVYRLTGTKDSERTGPFTIVLEPEATNEMFGRSAFRIHGDSIRAPGTASNGCIVLPRFLRNKIWNSGERLLTVTA